MREGSECFSHRAEYSKIVRKCTDAKALMAGEGLTSIYNTGDFLSHNLIF